MTMQQILRKIEKMKTKLAKNRDELRELISDLGQLGDDTDEAIALLDDAADALSKEF